jgi:hypothetical protein
LQPAATFIPYSCASGAHHQQVGNLHYFAAFDVNPEQIRVRRLGMQHPRGRGHPEKNARCVIAAAAPLGFSLANKDSILYEAKIARR